MPASDEPQQGNTTGAVGAGAAGGGLGAALAAYAQSLPGDSNYAYLLTVFAPFIAVGISGMWLFAKRTIVDPFVNRRLLDGAIDDARKSLEQTMADPDSSDEHKQEIRKIVEDLEKLRMEKYRERVRVVSYNA